MEFFNPNDEKHLDVVDVVTLVTALTLLAIFNSQIVTYILKMATPFLMQVIMR